MNISFLLMPGASVSSEVNITGTEQVTTPAGQL
jgi:hypothetical protein